MRPIIAVLKFYHAEEIYTAAKYLNVIEITIQITSEEQCIGSTIATAYMLNFCKIDAQALMNIQIRKTLGSLKLFNNSSLPLNNE